MLRSLLRWALSVLEVFVAAGAFFGGIQLVRDPSGALLQMPASQFLTGASLFRDWLIPGVILLLANGVFPLVVVGAQLLKAPWAKWGHLAVGVVLSGWMAVQGVIVGISTPIQIVFLTLGLVLLALAAVNWLLEARATAQPGPQHA